MFAVARTPAYYAARQPLCRVLCLLLLVCFFAVPRAHADLTLFLEEPYSYDGALAGTGHVALYLDHVCASSAVELRLCNPGEHGVVISRYRSIAGYDWIAIPLIPYLYAVDHQGDVPLFADAKLVAFLRDQYRRKHLESLAPDLPGGGTPDGAWYELVGSSYDRNIYGFQLATSAEQDARLVRRLNGSPNRRRFSFVKRNCANFVADVINFYYPHAVHRSVIGDLGVATPKQIAKTLVQFSRRHPELQGANFVIPQVPGSVRRSKPVHGILESVLSAKKYMLPLLLVDPYFAGGLLAARFGLPRFDPAKDALVLDSRRQLSAALTSEQRRSYQDELDELEKTSQALKASDQVKDWEHVQSLAEPDLDSSGKAVLQVRLGSDVEQAGVTRSNVLAASSSELPAKLLHARIKQELRPAVAKKTAQHDLASDLALLQMVLANQPNAGAASLTASRGQGRVPATTGPQ